MFQSRASAFVKRAARGDAGAIPREAPILDGFPGPHVPGLIASEDSPDRPFQVLEGLGAADWPLPWGGHSSVV